MLNCKRISELSSRELEQPLSLADKMQVATHVLMCADCRNFRRQLLTLRRAAQDYAAGRAVSTEPVESGAT